MRRINLVVAGSICVLALGACGGQSPAPTTQSQPIPKALNGTYNYVYSGGPGNTEAPQPWEFKSECRSADSCDGTVTRAGFPQRVHYADGQWNVRTPDDLEATVLCRTDDTFTSPRSIIWRWDAQSLKGTVTSSTAYCDEADRGKVTDKFTLKDESMGTFTLTKVN